MSRCPIRGTSPAGSTRISSRHCCCTPMKGFGRAITLPKARSRIWSPARWSNWRGRSQDRGSVSEGAIYSNSGANSPRPGRTIAAQSRSTRKSTRSTRSAGTAEALTDALTHSLDSIRKWTPVRGPLPGVCGSGLSHTSPAAQVTPYVNNAWARSPRVTKIPHFRAPHRFHCFSIDRAVRIR